MYNWIGIDNRGLFASYYDRAKLYETERCSSLQKRTNELAKTETEPDH